MIYINETRLDDSSVAIQVQGNLDRKSLPTLQGVCKRYFNSQGDDQISIDLKELVHCCQEAKGYLKEIRNQVTYVGLPEFLRLELFGAKKDKSH